MVSQEQTKELRARFETLGKCLDIQSKRSQVAAMQAESEAPSFWDDPKAAENFMKKMNGVKSWLISYDTIASALDDVDVLMELDPEGEDIDQATPTPSRQPKTSSSGICSAPRATISEPC